ncbi:MAG: hypothetical protein ACFE8B_02845 [Candidatus Hermodarchaeota archaeon]
MGFKKVSQDELKVSNSSSFLGMPLREAGKMVQIKKREKRIDTSSLGSMSEILILNEEFLEYQYQNNNHRKALAGYGNIVVFNNSLKDRIWDAFLKFSGTQFDKQDSEKGMHLGIFEPNSNKILKYEIVNSEILPDIVSINENIENMNKEIEHVKFGGFEDDNVTKAYHKNYMLLLGRENKVKFSISVENVSSYILEHVKVKKYFSNNFYDLEFKGALSKDIDITNNYIEIPIKNLNPGEIADLFIYANIFPKKKEDVRTGRIEVSFDLKNQTISEVEINHFSAYSHAMHAIRKTEKENIPNHWDCSLVFENHSDFKMKLNSILILDKSKKNTLLELDFNDREVMLVPSESYTTKNFDYQDEKEPTFSRKVEYSVDYKVEKNSMITVQVEDNIFKVVHAMIKKNIEEREIKSFEESKIKTEFIIKNQGTLPIKGIIAQEKIPADFLPPREISNFQFLNSSGELRLEDISIKISPDDDDPAHDHFLELNINLEANHGSVLIKENDFLQVEYPLTAVTPNFEKDYNFPLEIRTFYMKFSEADYKYYYVISDNIDKMDKSSLKITHRRRKLMTGKEIFPGRDINEFAIYITAKNGSNIKLSDVNITDAFPDSFELVSSNLEYTLSKKDKSGERKISFNLDTLQPYQEREIMYYLKNITGKEIKFSELESFFIG